MRQLVLGLSAAAITLLAWGQPPRLAPKSVAEPQEIDIVTSGIVLEKSKSAREDLKAIMNQIKAANARQEQYAARAPGARAIHPPVSAGTVANGNPCTEEDVASWQLCIDRVHAKLNGLPMNSSERADIDRHIKALRQDLDSISEMGEMDSLRLQMAMDRLSTMQTVLSNVMKKASDTSSSVIQNIK